MIVPFGRRKMIGVVVDNPAEPSFDPKQIKPIEEVLRDLPPFDGDWLRLARFAAEYYQRPLGEVMLPTLPPPLRKPSAYQGKRSAGGPVARLDGRKRKKARAPAQADQPPALNDAQQAAVETLAALNGFKPVLLYGVTGSGKTEVYLRAAERVLAAGRQVLLMVPEINLTPQLEGALRARLEAQLGPDGLAVMHSGLSDGERLDAWSRAQRGQARMLLGTRMAIFAPLSELGLIIVDEEHDASYKQQDGLRYSARDLAVWRAHDLNVPVVLGSATPSLETWQHAERGRYLRLALPGRARQQPAGDQAGGHAPPADETGPVAAIAGRHRPATGAQGAVAHLPEPPRLRAGAALPVLRLGQQLPALHGLHRAAPERQRRQPPALPPLRLPGDGAARLPRMRRPGPGADGARHPAHRGASGRAVSRGAHPAHRRRQHAQERQRRSAVRVGARGRGRHPGGHADGGQGPRLRAPGAGGCAQRRFHAVRA